MPTHVVICLSNNTLSIIPDPEGVRHQLLADNLPKRSTVNAISINSSKHYLEGEKQDETVDSELRNNIRIPEK